MGHGCNHVGVLAHNVKLWGSVAGAESTHLFDCGEVLVILSELFDCACDAASVGSIQRMSCGELKYPQ